MADQQMRSEHAPDYVREAFLRWLDDGTQTRTVPVRGEEKSIYWLLQELWNCGDTMPAEYVALVERMLRSARDERTSDPSYGSAARRVAVFLEGYPIDRAA